MLRPTVVWGLTLGWAVASMAAESPVAWIWSGAVTTHSAVVKAKIVGTDAVPRLRVGHRVFASDERYPSGVVAYRLDGLEPATDYTYQLELDGASAMAGHFRTSADDAMSFRFVFGSCASTGSSHRVFETMETLEPRFTLHMGDLHYENIAENEPAKFRRAFDRVLASERQSSLYRSAPIVYVWDDHDYGPNDSDETHPGKPAALRVFDEYVPHYPLERVDGAPSDVRQAATVGRVRFLLTDVRSHRSPDSEPDGPEKTMLGGSQRDWLLREIGLARDDHALVVWVNPVPWIAERGSGHGWGRYDWERRFIADRIRELGMTNRLLMLSGDAHMVAMDDGTHSNFATDAPPGEPGFPVVHAGPLDRYARPKGGPYSHGKAGRRILFGLIPIQQFALADVRDDGEVLEITLTGRNEDGKLLEGMSMSLECDRDGCRVVPSPGAS